MENIIQKIFDYTGKINPFRERPISEKFENICF